MQFKVSMLIGAAMLSLAACGPSEASQAVDSGPLTGAARAAARMALAREATQGQAAPMPANAAALDLAADSHDYGRLRQQMMTVEDPMLSLNWGKVAVFKGGGYAVALFYAQDLWAMGQAYERAALREPAEAAMANQAADTLKTMSALVALYALVVIQEDGLRCIDAEASRKHFDDAVRSREPMFAYLRAKPEAERRDTFARVAGLRTKITPVRARDPWLCASERVRQNAMNEALASGAATMIERDDPTTPGKDFDVVQDRSILFVDDDTWWTRVEATQTDIAASIQLTLGLMKP